MSKTKRPITPAEAIEILTAALSYCQQAGMQIQMINTPNSPDLTLILPGVTLTGASLRMASDVTPPPSDVTSPPLPHPCPSDGGGREGVDTVTPGPPAPEPGLVPL